MEGLERSMCLHLESHRGKGRVTPYAGNAKLVDLKNALHGSHSREVAGILARCHHLLSSAFPSLERPGGSAGHKCVHLAPLVEDGRKEAGGIAKRVAMAYGE